MSLRPRAKKKPKIASPRGGRSVPEWIGKTPDSVPPPHVISRKDARAAGLARYFTGKPCIRGHIDERSVSEKKCYSCSRVRSAAKYHRNIEKERAVRYAYRDANKDRVAESSKRFYQKHRERLLDQKKAYHADPENRARIVAYRKTRYAKMGERIRSEVAAYRKANPERTKEANSNWRAAHPEACQRLRRLRKARLKGAEGSHTVAEVAAIRKAQANKCGYCRAPLKRTAHLDHIVPLREGGSNWARNLQWLCAPCNLSKNAKDPIDFARSKGLLL